MHLTDELSARGRFVILEFIVEISIVINTKLYNHAARLPRPVERELGS